MHSMSALITVPDIFVLYSYNVVFSKREAILTQNYHTILTKSLAATTPLPPVLLTMLIQFG